MKRKRKDQNEPETQAYFVYFCDLSIDLDRRLGWMAQVLEMVKNEEDPFSDLSSESSQMIWEYLGKRAALEHVFFNRPIGRVNLEESKLKAEVWRVQKIKAAVLLKRKQIIP